MLRKIVTIKNVGRFINSVAPGNPELSRYTLIAGGNGFGKTTICAVLRSLKTGDAAHIAGRKTLGAITPIGVELLTTAGMSRFNGETWNATFPNLAIFDGVFVSENVHSGEVVDIDHRRNLYRVIVGEEGVRLAEEDSRLAAESREKTREITAAATSIQPHIPQGMTVERFIDLPNDLEIDQRIEEQERALDAVRQARQINERTPLAEISFPELPEGFLDILGRTLEDVSADAEAHIAEHLAAHAMTDGGGNWIAEGLPFADESCPFCGQGIKGLPLIAAYRSVFSKLYANLRTEISQMEERVNERYGDAAVGALNTSREQNAGTAEFWARYCAIDAPEVEIPADISDAMRAMAEAARALLARKATAPLNPIEPDAAFQAAFAASEAARETTQVLAQVVRKANDLIATKKQETEAADVNAAEAELALLKAVRTRHNEPVSGLCAQYIQLRREKENIDQRKEAARTVLGQHTAAVIQPYEQRINHYLEAFNAGFSIAETRHGYPGGRAASSYQLMINGTAIELGDGRSPADRPSFKNTLSAGDRTTLALAFFLAHLENDPGLADRIVVFDDPFSSQDAFRRRQTVHEIAKIARRCSQVIVLSHDATFLKQVWDKAPAAERIALTLTDARAQGSKIMPYDLGRACLGRTTTDIDDLQAFLATGAGNPPDLIRKLRGVLETYSWTTYPASFLSGQDWLGEIARQIREGGENHPASALYEELDQINDYTSQYYHGADVADDTPDDIDPTELTGYVRRTLKIVNALQA